MGALVEVLKERDRQLEQRPFGCSAHPELEQAPAEPVAVRSAFEQTVLDEIPGNAMKRALRYAGSACQLGKR